MCIKDRMLKIEIFENSNFNRLDFQKLKFEENAIYNKQFEIQKFIRYFKIRTSSSDSRNDAQIWRKLNAGYCGMEKC